MFSLVVSLFCLIGDWENKSHSFLSTVVPTSFVAVDSLDKTRFRFIAGHRFDYRCGEQTQEGKSNVLAFDLFAQH
jgi:hypothetical protein